MKRITLSWIFPDVLDPVLIWDWFIFGCCVGRFNVMCFIRMSTYLRDRTLYVMPGAFANVFCGYQSPILVGWAFFDVVRGYRRQAFRFCPKIDYCWIFELYHRISH